MNLWLGGASQPLEEGAVRKERVNGPFTSCFCAHERMLYSTKETDESVEIGSDEDRRRPNGAERMSLCENFQTIRFRCFPGRSIDSIFALRFFVRVLEVGEKKSDLEEKNNELIVDRINFITNKHAKLVVRKQLKLYVSLLCSVFVITHRI